MAAVFQVYVQLVNIQVRPCPRLLYHRLHLHMLTSLPRRTRCSRAGSTPACTSATSSAACSPSPRAARSSYPPCAHAAAFTSA
jgi:hypothetical protein